MKKITEELDITASIKTKNPKDVERFFADVKKSFNNIVEEDDEENKIISFNDFDDATGRKYDEENEEELIVQDEKKSKIISFEEYK